MAVLTSQQRFDIRANSIREQPFILTKVQIDEVVAALDDWLEANFVSMNQAIPQPQRGTLTIKQKFLLFKLIAERRFGNG